MVFYNFWLEQDVVKSARFSASQFYLNMKRIIVKRSDIKKILKSWRDGQITANWKSGTLLRF
jgi:pyridoxal/pyridoxine/pyridoxamine kinase